MSRSINGLYKMIQNIVIAIPNLFCYLYRATIYFTKQFLSQQQFDQLLCDILYDYVYGTKGNFHKQSTVFPAITFEIAILKQHFIQIFLKFFKISRT